MRRVSKIKGLILIFATILLAYLIWLVFEPAIRGAEIFYKGAGLSLLQLYIVAVTCILILALLVLLEKRSS